MLKNPYLNAFLAALYIVLIVLVLGQIDGAAKAHPSLLVPLAMLGLFVLSAAVMGLLFLYTSVELFLDNHRKTALIFFLKTVTTFAGFAVIFVLILVFFS